MKKLFLALIFSAISFGASAQGFLASLAMSVATECKEYNQAVAGLVLKKQERKARPIANDGAVFEVWVEGLNGAWTILAIKGKEACEVLAGSKIENAAPPPAAREGN